MGWLDPIVKRTVRAALKERLEPALREAIERNLDSAVKRVLDNHPRFQFVKAMQLQMLGCDPKMDPREAWNVAVQTLNTFLSEEGVEFGDPAYDWTRSGAVDLIHEYELHHWETAP